MSRVRILCRVQARYPFNSNDPSSLSFEQGDVIEVLTKLESGWWDGWCNGTRGWFPSNYVEVIEDYEEEDALTIRGLDDDRFSHMGKVPHAYSEGSDMIPSSRNGVPLRKNNEHRLSLPYQEGAMDAYGSRLRKQSQHCDPTNGSSLPPNWTMETTEDGSEFYYYNHVTGEMRSTHPADLSESEFEEDISYGVNGSVDDDDDDDEDDTFDFKSVDSRPWDERSVIDAFEDCTMPEKHTVGWIKRQTPQGRVYYVNSHTQEIVWDLAPADEQNVALPRPSPRSRSRQPSVRKTSVIDANEPLTWNKLSAHIALAIHNLNAAAKNAEKSLFVSSAAGIVNAIRLMLITSGTIDKESPHIKTSSVLRSHHRAMMAAMSKLVLSAQLSAHDTEDNISKMLTDSNDLLLAVRNFVSTCQDIPISVQHMDPRLQQSEKEGEQKSEGETDGPRAKFALQSDLADNLEAYGNSMHESVEAILASIKQGSDQEESRSSMSVVLFTQYRNLANQAAQFIGIIQDIDFHSVDESPLTNQLKAERQLLSDGLGVLFCWMQTMTDENIPLKGVVTEMESAAKQVSEPIRNICSCVSELVRVHKTTSATTTPTVTNAPDTQPVQKETITTALEENKPQTPIKEDTMLGNDGEKTVDSATAADAASENDNKLTHRQSSIKDSASETPSTPAQAGTDTPGSKTNSRKLQRIFGDDAAAAAAVAAAKPTPSDRPWFLQYDYDPSEIVFNMEGNVKGGTLPALVERLTLHDYLDMNFINTFLLTYRSFCTSMELLELLKARYNLTSPDGMTEEEQEIWTQKKLKLVRFRVFNVLKNWLETYYNEDDHVILDPLLEFTNTSIRSTLSFSADQLERLIRLRKDDESGAGLKKMVPSLRDPPEPILPRNRKKFKLMDIDTLEMARQLTIMDFKLYSSIRPVECLDKAWSKDSSEDGGNVAVNIRASIEYCNEVTSWVSDSILSQSDIKKRSNVIKYWVQVAEKCRLLNNFNTCMAVLSAFDNSSVGRLKRTWEMVGARTNQVLSQIRKLMGANRNFTEYRAIIHSINPPCIPFLGIYLQDLTFIEDGNPNYLKKSNNLINFAKRAKTAEVIREIQQYQSSLYQLKPVEELQQFILANLQSTRDEEALYNESLKLEPREREDEKITRLLQESGFL